MRRGEIFSAPCIWANSEFLEAPLIGSGGHACRFYRNPGAELSLVSPLGEPHNNYVKPFAGDFKKLDTYIPVGM